MNEPKEKCPACNGSGTIKYPDSYFDTGREKMCLRCFGKGTK